MGFFMKLLTLILITIILGVLFFIGIFSIKGDYFIIDWSHTPKLIGGNVTVPERNVTVTLPEKTIQLFPPGGCQSAEDCVTNINISGCSMNECNYCCGSICTLMMCGVNVT